MPFFWFGGSSSETAASTAGGGQAKSSSVAISPHHARKSSLSLSASSGQNARLAEVRSKATASYLQNQSDMVSNHRRTQSADISRRSLASVYGHGKKGGGIVANEEDDDSKHRGRIDQGLIDACNESKEVPHTKTSWWTSLAATAITPPSSFPDNSNSNSIENASKLTPSIDEAALKHRRTVSKTTYRV